METTLQVLIKARAKIADPKDWGKGKRGRYAGTRPLETCCAAEAIEDTAPSMDRRPAFIALGDAVGILPGLGSIPDWNDAPERTHAEVLTAFDKAIEAERTKVRA